MLQANVVEFTVSEDAALGFLLRIDPTGEAIVDDIEGLEAERIEGEFCSFLNPAEALQLVRVVVPRGQQ